MLVIKTITGSIRLLLAAGWAADYCDDDAIDGRRAAGGANLARMMMSMGGVEMDSVINNDG